MRHTTLVSTDTLAAHLGEPGYVIIDCRFALSDTGWGEEQYRAAHIPGAAYAHLDRDLSGVKTGTNGRHPLPDPATLTATLGRLGVANAAQVVAYDQDNGMFASRLWWLLRWMGHDAVAVLDGGFAKWLREQRPTTAGIETHPPAAFSGSARQEMIVDASAVAGRSRASTLLDARAPERFRGETEPLDRVAGHIPGARNHFFQENIGEDGTFRSPDDVRARIRAAVGGAAPGDIICYCGSGVTACQNLLAMEHAGLTGARLYPGSWSEWCADVARPVETGS
ncbi:MAG TPA: sulfurtransferase [Vicinamibacterales bacterium]|jgi:thiosulfate/3-mercaptopyruvate sulfurtransferase|nr:sulfurtransferase [Vicinamibacterales bacterium]